MDPIQNGIEIFNNVHKKLGKDTITDLKEFESFIKLLISETRGLVIVDFLDAGNWDRIESIEVNSELGMAFLHWHDYRDKIEDEGDKIARSMVFPGDIYGLCLQFQEMRTIRIRDITLFTFRGFALSTKEVEKLMKKKATQFKTLDDSDNFSIEIVRQIEEQWHIYNFLNTPIFSSLIIPKNIGVSASQSKNLLFAYNLWNCNDRISTAVVDLESKSESTDLICEKSNTLRRVMESILKIECCYRYRQLSVKKSYSQLLLGDLIKIINDYRSDDEKSRLNRIVRLSNELSHDSGKPVTKKKALELVNLVKNYCENLDLEIHSNPSPHIDW